MKESHFGNWKMSFRSIDLDRHFDFKHFSSKNLSELCILKRYFVLRIFQLFLTYLTILYIRWRFVISEFYVWKEGEKFVKLYLHSSCMLQITFHFDGIFVHDFFSWLTNFTKVRTLISDQFQIIFHHFLVYFPHFYHFCKLLSRTYCVIPNSTLKCETKVG